MSDINGYIKVELKQGKSKDEIKKNLKNVGWNEGDIDKAFNEMEKSGENNPERKISGTGKLDVSYRNMVQPIAGVILILAGIVATYILFRDYGFGDIQSYLGLLLIIIGSVVIILWSRFFSVFDKDRNKFSHKEKSIFKEDVRKHKLTDIKSIIYSENLSIRRSQGSTHRSIDRIAEIEMNNGVRYLLHKSTSSSRVGLLKNKTKKKAEEVADFVGVNVKNESFSPGNIAGKIMNKLGGGE